ncbi:MAG: glycosyltransferase family 4 protein [Candidatus Aenigmatarchaeota archaeon]
MNKKNLIMLVPLPPPYAGPEVSSQLLLKNGFLSKRFNLIVIKSNIRFLNSQKGKFDLSGTIRFFKILLKLIKELLKRKEKKVYFLLSQNRVGFLRDIFYIFVCKLFSAKLIAHLRGSNFMNFYFAQNFLFKKIIYKFIKFIDILIVQSENIKNSLVRLPFEKIEILPNGLDIEEIEKIKPINTQKKIILYVGHISYAKGFYDVLLTIPRVVKDFADVEYWFCGEIIEREKNIIIEQNRDKIKQAKIIKEEFRNFINYNGCLPRKEVLAIMKASYIFVLPSYSEGFPMAVLEAISCGLPVVVTKVGAIVDFVKDGYNGYLIDKSDIESLIEKIILLLKDEKLHNKISQINKNYVKENYSLDIILNRFCKIINN